MSLNASKGSPPMSAMPGIVGVVVVGSTGKSSFIGSSHGIGASGFLNLPNAPASGISVAPGSPDVGGKTDSFVIGSDAFGCSLFVSSSVILFPAASTTFLLSFALPGKKLFATVSGKYSRKAFL